MHKRIPSSFIATYSRIIKTHTHIYLCILADMYRKLHSTHEDTRELKDKWINNYQLGFRKTIIILKVRISQNWLIALTKVFYFNYKRRF